jgi:hypothetical protein
VNGGLTQVMTVSHAPMQRRSAANLILSSGVQPLSDDSPADVSRPE